MKRANINEIKVQFLLVLWMVCSPALLGFLFGLWHWPFWVAAIISLPLVFSCPVVVLWVRNKHHKH